MNTQDLHANVTLDMRGLTCPAPLLGAKRVVDDLKNEQVLLLISDCPGTRDDLFSWAEQTHNKVLKTESMPDGGTGYYVMKGQGEALKAHVILDIRGVVCPGPIVEAKKLLNGMNSGEILKLVSNCPGIRSDIVGWANTTGVKIVSTVEVSAGEYEFYLQKGWR
ncbi:MAG: sulfurtransferase TusA family protein [Nitrosomonadales bacterium]|nr:sulfurtransferase TusA family protein [Nitrosomonadales bacterium]